MYGIEKQIMLSGWAFTGNKTGIEGIKKKLCIVLSHIHERGNFYKLQREKINFISYACNSCALICVACRQ